MKNLKVICLIFVMMLISIITYSCSTKSLLKNSPFFLKVMTLGVRDGRDYKISPKGDQILFTNLIGDTKDYDYYGSYYLSSIDLPEGEVINMCKLADQFTKITFQKTGDYTKKEIARDVSEVRIKIVGCDPVVNNIVLTESVTHEHHDAIKAQQLGAQYKPNVTFKSYKTYLIYKECQLQGKSEPLL